ncbi:Superoxide dismutase (Mn/Fe) [Alphaproteobacteria bacterium]
MNNMQILLPKLPYKLDALEPLISARAIDCHYNEHHKAYLNNLNSLLVERNWVTNDLESLIIQTHKNINEVSVFNNAAQIWNHNFYWHSIKPNGGGIPSVRLMVQIEKDLDNFANFRETFIKRGLEQFGSGWVWLVWDLKERKLVVTKTSNADTPMLRNQKALIAFDVWEHAYYLDYQSHRSKYLEIFVDKLLNWEFAEQKFQSITK